MSNLSVQNQQWLLQSLDSNQNQRLDELRASDEVRARLDQNKNGAIDKTELATALQADEVAIHQGEIKFQDKQPLYIQSRETLSNIHSTVSKTLRSGHVASPRAADVVDAVVTLLVEDNRSPEQRRRDRMRHLEMSNLSYMSAVSSMRSTLRSVVDMTANATDSQSKALHSSAVSALNSSTRWGTGIAVTGFLLGVSGLESINSGLQVAYDSLRNSLRTIERQTQNLPNPAQTLSATDQAISQAFSRLDNLENKQAQNAHSLRSLAQQADGMEAKVTGRMQPYALIGAGVGAVAGAGAGYFLGGHSMKAAAIGAGIGLGASAGIGALTGHQIDANYKNKAATLRGQMETLNAFEPTQTRGQLQDLNQKLYGLSLQTQGYMGLDQASALDSDLGRVQSRVSGVQAELSQVEQAYQDSIEKKD